jgi:hypothetical protein
VAPLLARFVFVASPWNPGVSHFINLP